MAIQALTVAETLNVPKAWFKGDALQVILSIQGMEDFCDWRSKHNIRKADLFCGTTLFRILTMLAVSLIFVPIM